MKTDPKLWRSVKCLVRDDEEIAALRKFASRRKSGATGAEIRRAIRRVLFERDAAHIFIETFDAPPPPHVPTFHEHLANAGKRWDEKTETWK